MQLDNVRQNDNCDGVIVGKNGSPVGLLQPGGTFMPLLTRRNVLVATTGIAAAALAPRIVMAQAPAAPAGPFRRDPLPYPANALEPHIDAKTMEIHPERHHAAYVVNLNAVAKDHPQIAQKPIPE